MSLIDKLLIKFRCVYIGRDEFSTEYYEQKIYKPVSCVKRYAIYKDATDPSCVPALWHAWLHYLTNEIPNDFLVSYDWQIPHLSNQTGSKTVHTLARRAKRRANVSADYQIWCEQY